VGEKREVIWQSPFEEFFGVICLKITNLTNSQLIQSILFQLRLILLENHDEDGALKRHPNEEEKAIIEVAIGVSNITELIDQLYFVIELLSGYRKNISKNVSRYDYLMFQTENFYLRITSILDRCLRFTNIIFDIGIEPHNCKLKQICKFPAIKGTDIELSLKNLNDLTNKFRKKRNEVAHNQSFDDPTLNEAKGFYLLGNSAIEEMPYLKREFKKYLDHYVIEKKKYFKNQIADFEIMVDSYFEAIYPKIQSIILKNPIGPKIQTGQVGKN
jgi:hypothetical protein